ncbi:MAG: SbmA/BacA-like family transporter [Xanthobacteraceae bacterium]
MLYDFDHGVRDQKHLFPRFWRSASLFWRGRTAWTAWSLTALLVAIALLQLLVQYLLNLWNRNFFDALQRNDGPALWLQAELFVPLAAASITLAATSVWGRMTTQRKWREFLTRRVIEYWLGDDHFRHLNHLVRGSENAEYRIAEDVRIATDAPIDMTLALFTSLITAMTFFGVLWSVGGSLAVPVLGHTWMIPAYLVLGAIVYSSLFTGAMLIVGRPLTKVIEGKNQAEAEFRGAANLLREIGERTMPAGDEPQERRSLWLAVRQVLDRWRELCWQLVRTTVISNGNLLLAPVVGWVLCLPKYISGDMSLGELTQAAAAFVTVQGAFNWLVDNYQRLADWRSSMHRVATLLLAFDELGSAKRVDFSRDDRPAQEGQAKKAL